MAVKTTVAAAVLAMALVGSAQAADLDGRSDANYAHPGAEYNTFRGFYAGVGVGGEFSNNELEFGPISFDGIGGDGLIGSVVIGYDVRMGQFIIGPYVEGLISNAAIELNGLDVVSHDYSVIAGARTGLALGQSLIYAKIGHEWGFQSSDFSSADQDYTALNFGGGVETYIADHVSVTAEGVYVMGLDDHDNGEGLRALVRLNYRQ